MADVMQYGYFEFEFEFVSRYEALKKMALLLCSALLCSGSALLYSDLCVCSDPVLDKTRQE